MTIFCDNFRQKLMKYVFLLSLEEGLLVWEGWQYDLGRRGLVILGGYKYSRKGLLVEEGDLVDVAGRKGRLVWEDYRLDDVGRKGVVG